LLVELTGEGSREEAWIPIQEMEWRTLWPCRRGVRTVTSVLSLWSRGGSNP
jgi:hypothetical protein